MKILLVSLHARRSPQAVPLAAANLLAALPAGHRQDAILIDLFPEQTEEEMLTALAAEKPQLVSFSTYLWNRHSILRICARLKKLPQPPFILLGGPEASADYERLLAYQEIDAVLCGEGEESFPRLVEALSGGLPTENIPGLVTAAEQTEINACACDLTDLKSPWLSLKLPAVEGGVLWEVARGCPFHCSFCYDAKGLAGVRPLSEARLKKELDYFLANRVEQVWVLDSSFNAPPARGKTLLKMLIRRAPQLHYHLEAKAEFIDAETVDLLSHLSCSVQLGLQTADSDVLSALKRRIDPQRFWAGVAMVSDSQLTFGLDLIYGLPGDSFNGFCHSLETALGYRPNQVDIFPLAVLPGTELFQSKAEFALQADDEPPYLLTRSRDFSATEMENCRQLKVAVDLFYNRGRAVGFFLPFCKALGCSPLALLTDYADWLKVRPEGASAFGAEDSFTNSEIYDLQTTFLQQAFDRLGKDALWDLACDVLSFHYHYAEALLGSGVLPVEPGKKCPAKLRRAQGVRLVAFRHPLLGALESQELDLVRWHRLLKPEVSYGLLVRREGQVLVEELTDEFYALLRRAEKVSTRAELCVGLPPGLAAELFEFAWREGLLVEA